MLIVKSVSYDHNCIVCEFKKKTKYIFVIGVYFRLIDDNSSRNSLCDDRNVFKMYDVAKFLYCK